MAAHAGNPPPRRVSSPDTLPASLEGDAVYVLRDNGVRCVRHPCPSVMAQPEAGGQGTTITDVDFSALGQDAPLDSLRGAIWHEGLRAWGRIEEAGAVGGDPQARLFRVTRLPGSGPIP